MLVVVDVEDVLVVEVVELVLVVQRYATCEQVEVLVLEVDEDVEVELWPNPP